MPYLVIRKLQFACWKLEIFKGCLDKWVKVGILGHRFKFSNFALNYRHSFIFKFWTLRLLTLFGNQKAQICLLEIIDFQVLSRWRSKSWDTGTYVDWSSVILQLTVHSVDTASSKVQIFWTLTNLVDMPYLAINNLNFACRKVQIYIVFLDKEWKVG